MYYSYGAPPVLCKIIVGHAASRYIGSRSVRARDNKNFMLFDKDFILIMKHQLLLLSFLIYGCTSNYNVVTDDSIKQANVRTYHQVQEKISVEQVKINTNEQVCYTADSVHISSDSISFINALNNKKTTLPLSSINTIVRTLHTDGAIEGLVYGTFLGALAGGLVGYLIRDPEAEMSGLVVIGYGIVGAFTGLVTGTTYGALRGHVVEYRFIKDTISVK